MMVVVVIIVVGLSKVEKKQIEWNTGFISVSLFQFPLHQIPLIKIRRKLPQCHNVFTFFAAQDTTLVNYAYVCAYIEIRWNIMLLLLTSSCVECVEEMITFVL